MIIRLALDIRKLINLVYIFIKELFSISTLRKILLHFIALMLYILFSVGLASLLIFIIRLTTIKTIFHTVELDMAVSNLDIYSFVTFVSRDRLDCESYLPLRACDFIKNNAQYVDFNMDQLLYEITLEATVLNSNIRKNFYYDIDMITPDTYRNIKFQGMMVPVSAGITHWLYNRFISEEEIYKTKNMIVDFRFDKRPRAAILALKNIKDDTFIKDIKIHIDIKTNFLMKTLKKYEFLFFSLIFCVILWICGLIYCISFWIAVVLQIFTFCEHVKVKYKKKLKESKRRKILPRIVTVYFPIIKDV